MNGISRSDSNTGKWSCGSSDINSRVASFPFTLPNDILRQCFNYLCLYDISQWLYINHGIATWTKNYLHNLRHVYLYTQFEEEQPLESPIETYHNEIEIWRDSICIISRHCCSISHIYVDPSPRNTYGPRTCQDHHSLLFLAIECHMSATLEAIIGPIKMSSRHDGEVLMKCLRLTQLPSITSLTFFHLSDEISDDIIKKLSSTVASLPYDGHPHRHDICPSLTHVHLHFPIPALSIESRSLYALLFIPASSSSLTHVELVGIYKGMLSQLHMPNLVHFRVTFKFDEDEDTSPVQHMTNFCDRHSNTLQSLNFTWIPVIDSLNNAIPTPPQWCLPSLTELTINSQLNFIPLLMPHTTRLTSLTIYQRVDDPHLYAFVAMNPLLKLLKCSDFDGPIPHDTQFSSSSQSFSTSMTTVNLSLTSSTPMLTQWVQIWCHTLTTLELTLMAPTTCCSIPSQTHQILSSCRSLITLSLFYCDASSEPPFVPISSPYEWQSLTHHCLQSLSLRQSCPPEIPLIGSLFTWLHTPHLISLLLHGIVHVASLLDWMNETTTLERLYLEHIGNLDHCDHSLSSTSSSSSSPPKGLYRFPSLLKLKTIDHGVSSCIMNHIRCIIPYAPNLCYYLTTIDRSILQQLASITLPMNIQELHLIGALIGDPNEDDPVFNARLSSVDDNEDESSSSCEDDDDDDKIDEPNRDNDSKRSSIITNTRKRITETTAKSSKKMKKQTEPTAAIISDTSLLTSIVSRLPELRVLQLSRHFRDWCWHVHHALHRVLPPSRMFSFSFIVHSTFFSVIDDDETKANANIELASAIQPQPRTIQRDDSDGGGGDDRQQLKPRRVALDFSDYPSQPDYMRA
jgi:hypothetical protein